MCIWCQLFSRAVSKTTNLYSHHNVILIGTFCYFYKAELGVTVEINFVIMYAGSLPVWCLGRGGGVHILSLTSILQHA